VLGRELYRGVVVWNQRRKRDDWGQLKMTRRATAEWVQVKAEHLRIVPEDLWRWAQSRRWDTEGKAVRFDSGRISGRPPKTGVKNLLAGLATCAACGGGR